MKYTIYKTTNLINNKIYIGKHQTDNPNDNYLGSGKLLLRAIDKYGKENFKKEVLHIFDTEEEMNSKEKELINEDFVSSKDNYNICRGGHGGWSYVNSNESLRTAGHSKQMYEGIAAKLRGRPQKFRSPALTKAIQDGHKAGKYRYDGMKGKSHSKETRELMSKLSSGERNSQYGTKWITNGIENKKISGCKELPIGWRFGRIR